jgi:hypothetical protein
MKDENILLYQRITKILEKLTRDIEADMEERFHSLNRAYTAASQSVEDMGPHVRHLCTEVERASRILRDDLGRAAQVHTNYFFLGHTPDMDRTRAMSWKVVFRKRKCSTIF